MHALVPAILAALLLAPSAAARAEPSRAEIQQRIDKESAALEDVVEQFNKVREELKETKAAAARHAASLPTMERDLTTAEADIGQLAVTAYKTGGLRTADAVLGSGERGILLDRLGTLDHLARDRRAQVAGFTEAHQRYVTEKRRLDTALTKQNIQYRDLAARKVRIEADLKKLYELRRQAFGQETESGSHYTGKVPRISGKAGIAVRYAYGAIGRPYVWGDEGRRGYDCSGLTLASWRAAGKHLPHNAAMQWGVVAHIGRDSLMAGDLVFYRGLGHVALYVGNGQVIHAPSFGRNVELASINRMPPFGYGRVR